MAQIASWDKMDKEMYREHRAKAIHNIATVLEQYKHLYRVPVLLQPFSADCVQDGYSEFRGAQEYPAGCLQRLTEVRVEGGYLYTFHAPDRKVAEDDALLKQYYFEIFQIACLDVIRDWLQGYLGRNSVTEERYCSPAFGPGFYGMEMEMTETLLVLVNPKKQAFHMKMDRCSRR